MVCFLCVCVCLMCCVFVCAVCELLCDVVWFMSVFAVACDCVLLLINEFTSLLVNDCVELYLVCALLSLNLCACVLS